MAALMDPCSVMRGSRNGFETKLCESVVPALIDIGCDIHITTSTMLVKFFTKIFNKYLEKLHQNIYNDFKWFEDM